MKVNVSPRLAQTHYTRPQQRSGSHPSGIVSPGEDSFERQPPSQQKSPWTLSSPPQETLEATKRELQDRQFKPGELLLKINSGYSPAEELGVKVLESYQFSPQPSRETQWVRVKLPPGVDTAQGLATMRAQDSVLHAEINATFQLQEPSEISPLLSPEHHPAEADGNRPDDLDFRMWAMDNNGRRNGVAGADISALEAWDISVGTKNGPVIAVIDTGIDYKHPDLLDNMWVNPGEIAGDGLDNDGNGVVDDVHGYNAVADHGDPLDDHSHGTHCAGTIGAVGNNGRGVVGLNWDANLMAIKIFDKRGNTSLDAILRGLQYASKMGVDITNCSWGDRNSSEALKEAFSSMSETVHFAAAGNNQNNNDYRNYYPAGHKMPNMVAVAASDRRDKKPSFSNYGATTVDLAAPGAEILSTVRGGGYMIYSGTSMASPHAAGAAGLILSEFATASPQEVRDRLVYNSDSVPALTRTSLSRGRLNAAKALERDTVPPSTPQSFQVERADSKELRLSWTAGGDDGESGQASEVELWVSSSPIKASNLDRAERLPVASPGNSGETISFVLPTGHQKMERDYYFAMRTVDNVGLRSELRFTQAQVPAATEFYHNAFGPKDGFQGEKSWARVLKEGLETDWAWSDSPDGKYKNGSESSLLSPPLSLRGYKNCLLSLDAKHDIWRGDRAAVEVSTDGENWHSLGAYHGRQNQWKSRTFDLSAFDGQDLRIRVKMDADIRHNRDGITLDNFRLIGDRVES